MVVTSAELLAPCAPPDVSDSALRLARIAAFEADVELHDHILASGLIRPEVFYRRLANALGAPYLERYMPLAPSMDARQAIQAGVAPLAPNPRGLGYVLAPRGRALTALLRRGAGLARTIPDFAIAAPAHFTRLVLVAQARRIADEASTGLHMARPDLCAASGCSARQVISGAVAVACLVMGFAVAADFITVLLGSLFCAVFLAAVIQRLWALGASLADRPAAPAPLPDHRLPLYSIVLPVYKEARVVGKLLGAIADLDYPRAKLDVKIVVEACDGETLDALRGVTLPPFCEVLVAPPGAPRTKPRALNVALPFCRGDLLVIYDAEDEPEPAQLRIAAAIFASGPASLACLQARLCIDNAGDGWIAALFALEYAALFDVINPGFGALAQPFPLGGTSNHFRTETLRRLRGWDAWNVTEDADLGIRLSRFRQTTGVIASCTQEEAPISLRAWRLQRQRWLKGWMQTLVTHSREPVRFAREAGLGAVSAAMVTMLGAVLGALLGPVFFWMTVWRLLSWQAGAAEGQAVPLDVLATQSLFWLGVIGCLWPIVLGAQRRGLVSQLRYLPLLPAYYMLICLAAWGALFELVRDPFVWNKTEHGLARTSRRHGK